MSRKTGHLANSRAQAILRGREQDEVRQAAADLAAILATPQGRRFVWRLIEDTGVTAPSFAGADVHSTSFNEGRRSVGLGLMVAAQRDAPGLYVTALQEQLADRCRTEQVREAATTVPEEPTTPEE